MWGVYPLAYLVPVWCNDSAGWGVGRQLAFTIADVIAKAGYATLIHTILKLRSDEDVNAGVSRPGEPIWMSNDLLAAAVPADASALTQAGLAPGQDAGSDIAGRHTATQSPGSIDLDEQAVATPTGQARTQGQ